MIDTVRDTAILVTALAGAPISIAAALKLPVIGKGVRYLGRVLVAEPLAVALGPVIEKAVNDSERIKEIDRAVNTRPVGAPTLSDDVEVLTATVTDLSGRVTRIDARLASMEHKIGELVDVS